MKETPSRKQIRERISDVLNQLMEEHMATQAVMANMLRISRTSLKRYLDGSALADIYVIERIANLAGFSIDELLRP